MDNDKVLETLFQYASEYRFDDFERLLSEYPEAHPAEVPAEAWLMRAQIGLFAADETFAADLEKAGSLEPSFPCLAERWTPDSPNRFVVFSEAPGALERFLGALPGAQAALGRLYGEAGENMVRQVQSELLYYRGEFGQALALAEGRAEGGKASPIDAMTAHYVRFRCYLATGAPRQAEQCMLEMIGLAKTHPECVDLYRVVRDWANLTTGWSGDTPRFWRNVEGEAMPVLEDRLTSIRKGISQLSHTEEPFAEYARRGYGDACTMREHYMDIFYALYWLQAGDHQQMASYLKRACEVSAASGLVMPFVEYGRQILPLLQCAWDEGLPCSQEWIARVMLLAGQYEESLGAYRA